MSSPVRHRIPEHVHWRRFDSELVVLDLKAGEYFGLSEVAADAFERIAGGKATNEVMADLLTMYDVEPSRLEHDIHALVESLLSSGLLITISNDDATAR
jgi:Coenzyme PQQ synthesis protein D (PqqD)